MYNILIMNNDNAFEKRKKEMLRLRHEEGLTLQEIGSKFNLSRERVRQIIGNTGKDFMAKQALKNIGIENLENMTSKDVSLVDGTKTLIRKIHGKIHHKNFGGGSEAEDLVSKKLTDMGFKNKQMHFLCSYDIELDNGTRIDVKHTAYNEGKILSQGYAGPTYQFRNMKYGKDCDFFICVVSNEEWFIIPAGKIRTNDIRIPWPQCGKKPSKWHKYINDFDLLR